MNSFFQRDAKHRLRTPESAYVRFDDIEPQDIERSDEIVISLSGVDAASLESALAPYGVFGKSARTYWREYWRSAFERESREPNGEISGRFDNLSIFHFVITLTSEEFKSCFAKSPIIDPESWQLLEQEDDGPVTAEIYNNIFGDPTTSRFKITEVSREEKKSLNLVFDMDTWPNAKDLAIRKVLPDPSVHFEQLVAYDVGQGAAVGLINSGKAPWMYFDLGCGVYGNKHTTPTPLRFCLKTTKVIVLSHWDADHWTAASDPLNSPALAKDWIVPRQPLGASHTLFANSILGAGGKVHVWGNKKKPIRKLIGCGQRFQIFRCTGNPKNRNASCLGIIIEDLSSANGWLMTGDSGYDLVPLAPSIKPPSNYIGVVVPHHGAKMPRSSTPPSTSAGSQRYCRLHYSFGPDNRHGKSSIHHPVDLTVQDHESQGWDHGTWHKDPAPGTTLACGDVLATAQHPTKGSTGSGVHLGGTSSSWTITSPPTPPCGLSNCDTDVTQS